MGIPYDAFVDAFLHKIREYELINLYDAEKDHTVYSYMKRAVAKFKRVSQFDFGTADDVTCEYTAEIGDDVDVDEIVDIVSDGMTAQWLKPYVLQQELLENALNTNDYSTYSPAELLMRVGDRYDKVSKDFTQAIREYSYNHGDLSDLHL